MKKGSGTFEPNLMKFGRFNHLTHMSNMMVAVEGMWAGECVKLFPLVSFFSSF